MKTLSTFIVFLQEFFFNGDSLVNTIKRNKMNSFLLFTNVILAGLVVFLFEQAINNHDKYIAMRKEKEIQVEKLNMCLIKPDQFQPESGDCERHDPAPIPPQVPKVHRKPSPMPSGPSVTDKLNAIRNRVF